MSYPARYRSFSSYFKERYGARLQKIVLDAGFTCPNRDGTLSTGGCTYCDNMAFHPNYSTPDKSLIQQMDEGIMFHQNRYRRANGYLAYFQSYSNTYAPLDRLREVYTEALSHPQVRGLVVGTRPDCIDDEKLDLLKELSSENIIIIEYGIESCYNRTLERINRHHTIEQAIETVEKTASRGLHQGAHFIFGLPGESKEDMMATSDIINKMPLSSLKFHQLQIIKGTPMEREFAERGEDFYQFGLEEYIDFFADYLQYLRPDLCIERFAGEVPPRFVNSTPWGKVRNPELLQMLEKRLEQRDIYQGSRYNPNSL